MRIVIVGGYARSLINFRGELIKTLVKKGHEVITMAPEEGFAEKIEPLGARYVNYPLQRAGMNPLKDFQTFLSLRKKLKEFHPDKILFYTIKPVIYGSLASGSLKGTEVYSLITGLGYAFRGETRKQKMVGRITEVLYKRALDKNRKVFFQNPDDIELFVEKRLVGDSKTVLVNGSGVDLERFYYSEPREKTLSFLLIARLLWDKGIGEYVEAARKIKEKYPYVGFKLVGDFDSNPSAIKKEDVDRWAAEGIIECPGRTDDVRPYVDDCSVYVLPSYREGTPRTVLEAMSMGRPIITTDAPGCRETVEEGFNGFLVPVKDSKSLAEIMERFIITPELISSMGKRSREIAEEKYDVHKVNKVILEAMGLE